MRYELDKFKLGLPDKMKNIVKKGNINGSFAVKLLNFKVFWLMFG